MTSIKLLQAQSDYFRGNISRPMRADTRETFGSCQFIVGTPTRKEIRKYGSAFFMCNQITVQAGPYCEYHRAICYVLTPAKEIPIGEPDPKFQERTAHVEKR